MFKRPIAAAIGLSAMLTAAHADTIIIQSQPFAEPITRALPLAAAPFASPAFDRMFDMCDRMGMDCEPAFAAAIPGADLRSHPDTHPDPGLHTGHHPLWSPEALADAEKLYALMAQDWIGYGDLIEERHDRLRPVPIHPYPHGLFGWDAPDVVPLPMPRSIPRTWPHVFPRSVPQQYGHLSPLTLPTPFPMIEGLPRHHGAPHGIAPHVPRGVFPRGVFPWPSL